MGKKLKVGLLLDGHEVSAFVYEILSRIIASKSCSVDLVIMNDSDATQSKLEKLKANTHKIGYYIYTQLDAKLYTPDVDPEGTKDATSLLKNVDIIKVKPIQKKFTDRITDEDVVKVESYELDVILRFGFRIVKGGILDAAKYGIWSYHHGDNKVNRGGPPAFWETVENWPETGTIVQRLNDKLDGGTVLFRSWTLTHPISPKANFHAQLWTSVPFMPRLLDQLYNKGAEAFFDDVKKLNQGPDIYNGKIYRAPKNLQAAGIIAKQVLKIAHKAYQKTFYLNHWFLLYHFSKGGVSTDLQRFKKITSPKDRFWADPFVMTKENRHYVFFEELMYNTDRGHISVFEIKENGEVTEPVPILKPDYHLSYPFIFEVSEKVSGKVVDKDKNELYMIPESAENETVELHRCVEFPHKWEFVKNLFFSTMLRDSTLFYHNNKWWLFATKEEKGGNSNEELYLYFADDFKTDQWTSHPQNPIISDTKRARPAGKIYEQDGKLYRPSQKCWGLYGYGLNINEIITLNETEYKEEQVKSIEPKWDKKLLGVHTLAYADGLTVSDGFTYRAKYW